MLCAVSLQEQAAAHPCATVGRCVRVQRSVTVRTCIPVQRCATVWLNVTVWTFATVWSHVTVLRGVTACSGAAGGSAPGLYLESPVEGAEVSCEERLDSHEGHANGEDAPAGKGPGGVVQAAVAVCRCGPGLDDFTVGEGGRVAQGAVQVLRCASAGGPLAQALLVKALPHSLHECTRANNARVPNTHTPPRESGRRWGRSERVRGDEARAGRQGSSSHWA